MFAVLLFHGTHTTFVAKERITIFALLSDSARRGCMRYKQIAVFNGTSLASPPSLVTNTEVLG